MSTQIADLPEIEVFFDGGCPLCVREISLIRHWDHRRQRIKFTDIHGELFNPQDYGKTQSELMERMHARLADGTWITGVEVFRRMYAAVGFGPIVWVSRWPGISQLMDLGYTIFARNRLWITGRCASGTCSIHQAHAKRTSESNRARSEVEQPQLQQRKVEQPQ